MSPEKLMKKVIVAMRDIVADPSVDREMLIIAAVWATRPESDRRTAKALMSLLISCFGGDIEAAIVALRAHKSN